MDNHLAASLGLRISTLMKQSNIEIEELAKQTTLPTTYLALIVQGMRLPDLTELRDIAAALNASLDFLINGKPFGSASKN